VPGCRWELWQYGRRCVGERSFRAHSGGDADTAAQAWARIARPDEPAAAWLERAAEFSHRRREARAEVPPRQRLLELSEAAYGPDHHEVARTLDNLGTAWRDLGDSAKARELYVRALRILLAHVPSGHSDVSIVTRNLRSVAPDLVVLNDGRVVRGAGDAPSDAGFDHSTGHSIT
jgi:Tetratricopeptide repeat